MYQFIIIWIQFFILYSIPMSAVLFIRFLGNRLEAHAIQARNELTAQKKRLAIEADEHAARSDLFWNQTLPNQAIGNQVNSIMLYMNREHGLFESEVNQAII